MGSVVPTTLAARSPPRIAAEPTRSIGDCPPRIEREMAMSAVASKTCSQAQLACSHYALQVFSRCNTNKEIESVMRKRVATKPFEASRGKCKPDNGCCDWRFRTK